MQKKRLTLNLQEGNPPSLHPHIGVDLRSRCLYLALYEPLMRRGPKGVLEPAAAASYEVDATQTIYTFHLRPQKWSNGEPVTAAHFAQAWRFALDPSSNCVRADLFYPIKNAIKAKKGELPLEAIKITTPDQNTLVVELEHPTPYFLDLTATSFFSPMYQSTKDEPACFNGPFVVGEWVHDQKLVLRQNEHYWDRGSVQLQEVCFTMLGDPMTAFSLYEQGELDLVGDPFSSIPFDSIPSLMESGELKTQSISRIFYILLNTNAYPLNNQALRKALALSIDRNLLTKHLFYGQIPTMSHLPETLSMLDEKELEQKTKEAAALFEQALSELKLSRENFPKIVFNYANLTGQRHMIEFIQEQWRKNLGISVELVCSDWNVHVALLRKKNYQIGTIHLTTLYQDPMFYFDLFREKESLANYSGWESAQFRSLLDRSEKTIDTACRKQLLQQAEQHLFEEMPVIPVFTQKLQFLVQKDLELVISDLGIYDFKWTRFQQNGSTLSRR